MATLVSSGKSCERRLDWRLRAGVSGAGRRLSARVAGWNRSRPRQGRPPRPNRRQPVRLRGERRARLSQAEAHSAPIVADMPTEPTQARRFGKARQARSATLTEDYVELIADLLAAHGEARATEVAKRLGVTHPTALKSIA